GSGVPRGSEGTVYEVLGEATFRALAEAFYRRVESDPVLRAVFPPDLSQAAEKQALFLMQYFGGPTTYSEKYGAPMLRMRHMPFAIDRAARDRWIEHMLAAIQEVGIPEPYAAGLADYFEQFSLQMINRAGPDAGGATSSELPS
ncbi:MAG TPA: hypothetical protein VGK54_05565, partial [Chloroflexota bacterium]